MSRLDVVQLRHRGIRSDSGATVALLTGGGRGTAVEEPDGGLLLRVEYVEGAWFARRPDGEAILRIDGSLGRFHDVTYADGRTGEYDASPTVGAWELRGDTLDVHARAAGNPLTAPLDWTVAQDGSLDLVDFLATVVTYRQLRRLRRERIEALGGLA